MVCVCVCMYTHMLFFFGSIGRILVSGNKKNFHKSDVHTDTNVAPLPGQKKYTWRGIEISFHFFIELCKKLLKQLKKILFHKKNEVLKTKIIIIKKDWGLGFIRPLLSSNTPDKLQDVKVILFPQPCSFSLLSRLGYLEISSRGENVNWGPLFLARLNVLKRRGNLVSPAK